MVYQKFIVFVPQPDFCFVSELYFLIERFLSAGPCKDAARVSIISIVCQFQCVSMILLLNFILSFQVLRRELSDYGVSKNPLQVSRLQSKLRGFREVFACKLYGCAYLRL